MASQESMELCIIGQEKSESNIKLIEEAEKKFDSAFFVPIDGIRIGLTDKFSITYRASDILKFRAIMPRIPRSYYPYTYQLLSLFPEDTYMSVRPISFLLSVERFFILTVLRKRGIDTLNLRLTRSKKAATRILEKNSFPLILRTSEKKTGIVVNNESEAKGIIDALVSLQQPIMIEDVIKDMVSVYVAEPEIIASVRKKTKERDILFAPGKIKKHKLGIDAKILALDAARAIEAQVVRVDMSLNGDKPKIVNIELNPDLTGVSRETETNIPQKVIYSVYDNYRNHMEKPILVKFFDDARSVLKTVLQSKHLVI